jgi:methylglutaconyl-CoA hydratase
MPDPSLVIVEHTGPVCRVTLNRPDVHHAFDERLIEALSGVFATMDEAPEVRVVVLASSGPSFSAGADLGWMRRMAGFDRGQNLEDARKVAAMFHAVHVCEKPVVARVQGLCLGGGCGLVACSDIAIGAEDALFGFSEVKLGLVPATISPFVVGKIGHAAASRYFLTGERFGAEEARRIGLLSTVRPAGELDAEVDRVVGELLSAAPAAIRRAKLLLRELALRRLPEVNEYTARLIADVRASDEAREGLTAFLEKRRPSWVDPGGRAS